MKSYELHSDLELLQQTALAAKNEKAAMLALLDFLVEVDLRKLYAVKACSTLFDYLVRELHYSESQAADRVNTVRLMRVVPEVKAHLETGKLSLTTASQIQRFVRAEEKAVQESRIGRPSQSVPHHRKESLIELCLNQPKREVEKILFSEHSVAAQALAQERIARVSQSRTELKFTISDETLSLLEQLRDLIGNRSLEKIFDQSVELFLKQEAKKRGALEVIQRPKANFQTAAAKNETNSAQDAFQLLKSD